MANMDLLSYERDSRWMPHLSWTYPDWTLQEKMAQQAAQREQAWQKIANKLGPLLIGPNVMASGVNGGAGSSFGQSDFIVSDFEENDHQDRAYEKAPLLSADIKPHKLQHANKYNNNHKTRNSYQSLSSKPPLIGIDSIDSLRPSQSPIFSDKGSQSSGVDVYYLEQHKRHYKQTTNPYLNQVQQQQYDCESFQKAKRRCWTVSSVLILLAMLLLALLILMALGIIRYKTFPGVPL